jgi:hypothetical protein
MVDLTGEVAGCAQLTNSRPDLQKRLKIALSCESRAKEAQARWFAAHEAMEQGRSGIKAMTELTGLSSPTILRGPRELRTRKHLNLDGRVQGVSTGRKRVETNDPGVLPALRGSCKRPREAIRGGC